MELLIPLVALVSLALLAIRFGADSRPALRSEEHRFADAGLDWSAIARPAAPARPAADASPIRRLRWAPLPDVQPGNASSPCPTLQALDRAREPGLAPFAVDSHAARLEQRALQLIDQQWSERVWLTGLVDRARFDLVCDALERDRQAMHRTAEEFAFEQSPPIAS